MRVAKTILMSCLLALPTAVLADPTAFPPPDAAVSYLNYEYVNFGGASGLNGLVGGITDTGSCLSGCGSGAFLYFNQTGNNFAITGPVTFDDSTGAIVDTGAANPYLEGTITSTTPNVGGDFTELATVTLDNNALWSAFEGQSATSFGAQVVLIFNTITYDNGGNITGGAIDIEPAQPATVTPEPASLTLLISGLAAGVLRRRNAAKK